MGVAYNTSIVRDGLIFHLDAANTKSYMGTGTDWNDLSPTRNTVTGGVFPTFLSTPPAMEFNGSTSSIQYPGLASVLTAAFTCESVIYLNTIPRGFTGLIYLGDFTGTYMDNEDFRIQSNGDNSSDLPVPLTVSTWYHTVACFNPRNEYTLYVNGDLIATVPTTDNNIDIQSPMQIGNRLPSDGVFDGRIALAKVYNRPLTHQEVIQNFESIRGRFGL